MLWVQVVQNVLIDQTFLPLPFLFIVFVYAALTPPPRVLQTDVMFVLAVWRQEAGVWALVGAVALGVPIVINTVLTVWFVWRELKGPEFHAVTSSNLSGVSLVCVLSVLNLNSLGLFRVCAWFLDCNNMLSLSGEAAESMRDNNVLHCFCVCTAPSHDKDGYGNVRVLIARRMFHFSSRSSTSCEPFTPPSPTPPPLAAEQTLRGGGSQRSAVSWWPEVHSLLRPGPWSSGWPVVGWLFWCLFRGPRGSRRLMACRLEAPPVTLNRPPAFPLHASAPRPLVQTNVLLEDIPQLSLVIFVSKRCGKVAGIGLISGPLSVCF